ncbi:MAG: response regulator transcription factor [Lachnospiraceae bacterium]|nr:response regulator transcription factor [Lachnospiraceae bacterium]
MLRIGICDDEIAFGCQLETYLEEYSRKENIEIDVKVFISGEEYLQFMDKEPALDILFLDIELGKEVNGVIVGSIMRSDLTNESTQIVYVSSKESYAMQLFQNRPMDFLVKPIKSEDIEKIMNQYKRLFSNSKNFFEFHVGKASYRICTDEVIFFQCSGKKVVIRTNKGQNEYYGGMEGVIKQIDSGKFWNIHKSYVVNVNYVSEFHSDKVIMTTGDELPISRASKKNVQEKLLKMSMSRRRYQ